MSPFLTTLLSSFKYLSLTYDILWKPPPTLPFLLMNWFIWKGNTNIPGEQGQTDFLEVGVGAAQWSSCLE